jgi:hypothetical protein
MKSFFKNYFTAQYMGENSNNRPLVFLQKPFSGKDLITKVRDILDNPQVSEHSS